MGMVSLHYLKTVLFASELKIVKFRNGNENHISGHWMKDH